MSTAIQKSEHERMGLEQALSLFAAADTAPELRRDALSLLMDRKALSNRDDKGVALAVHAGRDLVLKAASGEPEPGYRLLAIAEAMRMRQVADKDGKGEIERALAPALQAQLPPLSLLARAEDRANAARACLLIREPWVSAYMATAVAEEDSGEIGRELLIGLLVDRLPTLSAAVGMLAQAFERLKPETEAPGDTVGRRLTRTLVKLRLAIVQSERAPGADLGKALYGLVVDAFSRAGKPQDDKVKIDLSRELVLAVHDVVRTRFSLVTDASMYEAVRYCKRLFNGAIWPKDAKLDDALNRLVADVSEALLLLGRQGTPNQELRAQLDVLCNAPARARGIARELAAHHEELPEHVREWLETGRLPSAEKASEAAIELAASNADASIGLALRAARGMQAAIDSAQERLVSSLEMYDPILLPAVEQFLSGARMTFAQVTQAARLRELDLYGTPGEEVDFSAKFFDITGQHPRPRMVVLAPAIVRMRADGGIGEVILKGRVE
jgi:hypothetical protein